MSTKTASSVSATTVAVSSAVAVTTAAALAYLSCNNYDTTSTADTMGKKKNDAEISSSSSPKIFQHEELGPKVKAILTKYVDKMTSPESLLKITRQLDFWLSENLKEQELLAMTETLAERATILSSGFTCPKKRFGKTELQIPIVTCGGMRLQQTWMPDMMPWPLSPRKSQVLNSPSQDNLIRAIRSCLKAGINHFETARFYGTSEYQFCDALSQMMESGEIKRKDFIFQTKLPPTETRKEFEDSFAKSWAHCQKLGYIDLLSMWCVSSKEQTAMVLKEEDDSCMAAALDLQKQGKIKHVGFSTHGSAENILQMVNSERFAYINLHAHYLTSYHATGTPDGHGGEGNQQAVKRALELDMGVFLISPIDKGGHMYMPSRKLAKVLGPNMTPIEFAMLTAWQHSGHHTASVGFARLVDIEDALASARRYTQAECKEDLKQAMERMDKHMEQELGKEWKEKGLLNIPSCENESTDGIAIGNILGLYNLMKALGLYDFCAARYDSFKGCPWNKKKSFEENRKKMPGANLGRAYIAGTDYSKALASHYDAQAAVANMKQLDEWMTTTTIKKKANKDDEATTRKANNGFDCAYDLRVWESFPGDTPTLGTVVAQNLTGGLFGSGGGPTKSAANAAAKLVEEIKA